MKKDSKDVKKKDGEKGKVAKGPGARGRFIGLDKVTKPAATKKGKEYREDKN